MARIAGVNIPTQKKVFIALRYIYGVGPKKSDEILKSTNIDPHKRVNDLIDQEVLKIREYIDSKLKVEGDLRREVSMNIKRLLDLKCYRGLRHRHKLPVRGQRTPYECKNKKR